VAFYRSSVRIAEAGPQIAASQTHLTLLTIAIVCSPLRSSAFSSETSCA